jgi:hypothetical protein
MSNTAHLLEVLRDAAQRGDDLAAALRGCNLPGAERAAQRLLAGASLPEALQGMVPARIARLLAGSLPPMATVAALLADEAWRDAERRRLCADHLAYPLACLALLGTIAIFLGQALPHGPWYAPLVSQGWALVPFLLGLVILAAPWAPRSWKLPGSGWATHLDQASLWARAGLAVQWRLTEEQALRLLGADLTPVTMVLGTPGAETYCRTLCDWHRAVAKRRLIATAFLAATLLLLTGGGLVLGSARMWTGMPV